MKIYPRLFSILVITAVFFSSCGAPLQDSSVTESVIPETENATSTGIVQDTSSGYIEKYEIAVVSTKDEKYPVVAIHKNGERLIAVTETNNSSGKTPTVTGVVWFSPEGQSIVMFIGDDGLPNKMVVGENIIIFSNYTENSVDIGITELTGETEIVRNVPVNPNDLLELRAVRSQTSDSMNSYKLAALSSSTAFDPTISQMKKILKIATLSFSALSCAAAAAGFSVVTFGASLVAIGFACSSIIMEAVEYFVNDNVFPASTGFGLEAVSCAKEKDLFSCAMLILEATELAISEAENLIVYLDDQLGELYTKIDFALYEGEASYTNKTNICTCKDCGGEKWQARIIISEDGFVTGELDSYIPFSGPRDKIAGAFTDDEPNNCNSICTYTFSGELTNGDNTLKGIVDETCTPGDCEFNNCAGIWAFSLEKK